MDTGYTDVFRIKHLAAEMDAGSWIGVCLRSTTNCHDTLDSGENSQPDSFVVHNFSIDKENRITYHTGFYTHNILEALGEVVRRLREHFSYPAYKAHSVLAFGGLPYDGRAKHSAYFSR